ncbi:hypothetical protein WSM22_19820 [Cytophagales bacterium WSM2-2]|nr:hypothetical protein WSM22_19820 [Cytophagales bacterium WSM2-2]
MLVSLLDSKKLVKKTITMFAKPDEVWNVLTNSRKNHSLFDYQAYSNWEVGGEIVWKGSYQGYDSCEKGEIISIINGRHLKYTSFDPSLGTEDIPENYLVITYDLEEIDGKTEFTATVEGFTEDESQEISIANSWDKLFYLQLNLL